MDRGRSGGSTGKCPAGHPAPMGFRRETGRAPATPAQEEAPPPDGIGPGAPAQDCREGAGRLLVALRERRRP